MTNHKLLLAAGVGLLVAAQPSTADTLLDDDFNNSNLAVNPDIGGGFVFQDNGVGAGGSATEAGSLAQITDGSANNTAGIRSTNAFDLSDSSLTYSVSWEVGSWDMTTGQTPERVFFTLQTNDSWMFAGDAEESRIILAITANNTVGSGESNTASLRYQNRSASSNTNFFTDLFDLGSLDDDPDGFTATLTFDATSFSFTTTGLDATNQVNISDTWANLGTDFATAFGTDGAVHVAAYVQDAGPTDDITDFNRGELDIDRITLTAVPEPGSLALLGLGGLLIAARRRRKA
ncbi:MAG: PEP-CTERM sorting domain-containing protein [Planctomycetota bacterium]